MPGTCCPQDLLPTSFPIPKVPHLVLRFLGPLGFSPVIDSLLPLQARPKVPQSNSDGSHRDGDDKVYPHVSASNRFALIWRPIEQRGAEEGLDLQESKLGITVPVI